MRNNEGNAALAAPSKNGIKLKGKREIVFLTVASLTVFYSVFVIFPILYALFGSFHDWNPMIGKLKFKGFGNYVQILGDPLFWRSLARTIYFTAVVVTLRTAIGFVMAIELFSIRWLRDFFRTVYFVPVITSMVGVSVLWIRLLDPTSGVINTVLGFFGLPELSFLKDPVQALPSIMLMTIWKDAGYAIILFLAGLGSIPATFYEAAAIDGASRWRILKDITIPLLQPTTVFVLVTSIIAYMQVFAQIFVMTDQNMGGPGDACWTTVFQIWQEAFVKYNFGVASAISFLFFIVVMGFSIVQMRIMRKEWEY